MGSFYITTLWIMEIPLSIQTPTTQFSWAFFLIHKLQCGELSYCWSNSFKVFNVSKQSCQELHYGFINHGVYNTNKKSTKEKSPGMGLPSTQPFYGSWNLHFHKRFHENMNSKRDIFEIFFLLFITLSKWVTQLVDPMVKQVCGVISSQNWHTYLKLVCWDSYRNLRELGIS